MRNPKTIRDLAQMFGLITDGSNECDLNDDLHTLLTRLAKDVSGDQNIGDGHARFYEHVTVMTLFGDHDGEAQTRLDNLSGAQVREANALEVEAIDWIRAHWLK